MMAAYWTATADEHPGRYPRLDRDLAVDVAVVGAGIVGLTAAGLLSRAGKSVAVLEARQVGAQATGKSTAKVTSQHGLVYRKLVDKVGEDGARTYGEANQAAVEHIARLVDTLAIDCAFERRPAFVYGTTDEHAQAIEAEVEVAARLGLPAALDHNIALPFPVTGAIRFDGQAQIDPWKYLTGLAAAIADRAEIFETTRASEIDEGEPRRVRTEGGATVTAADVVVATQIPIIPDGMFFAKAYPFSHPMLAARVDPSDVPEGMFISAGEPVHSFRTDRSTGTAFLVATGGTYKSGHADEEMEMFDDLERFVKEAFGVGSIDFRWTNEDFGSMDGLPFVGRPSAGTEHLFVATGFNAWGITNGTAAGMILADLVLGRPNPWAALFDATRIRPIAGGPAFVKENLHVARHFVSGRFLQRRDRNADIAPGSAAILDVDGEQVAVFRAEDGGVEAVSAICTHLGCVVGWNPVDRTWDCPCHGSRFERDGTVLSGPATAPLEKKEA